MPEHLRALAVILSLATLVFVFAKAPACAVASSAKDFERRRNLWFAVTLVAFLAHNFWFCMFAVSVLLLFALPREPNKLALFFLLLFAVPAISAQIPGMGVVEHLFTIDYLRLLALVILLPAFLSLRKRPDVEPFGGPIADKLIAAYLILNFFLQLPVDTFTNALRHGVFYAFTDVFLPYYVASRSLRTLAGFRDALMAFVVAALVLGGIAVFEFGKGWLLYGALDDALGARWGISTYLRRDGSLRAQGTTGAPIPLGYVMAVAIGFLLYLRKSVRGPLPWGMGLLALVAALIASLSRGPWLGAAVIIVVFVATGPSAARRMAGLGLLGAALFAALLASPAGETIVDHLPFVGTIDDRNVTYRQKLLHASIQVMMEHPLLGVPYYRHLLASYGLIQGQGIVDVVNTYLRVGMESGLVGLSLFVGFFAAIIFGIFRSMKSVSNNDGELHRLGQALLATLLGILAIIFTVSSVTVIPVVYWAVAGLGAGYARMVALRTATEVAPAKAVGQRT